MVEKGQQWGEHWPQHITMGEASNRIGFDLFAHDDPSARLTKAKVPTGSVNYTHMFADDDYEDQLGPIKQGLSSGGHNVPPVVFDHAGALTDGHHRVTVAKTMGLSHVAAYVHGSGEGRSDK